MKEIINCHTHIFTIDHVPNEFGKSLLPWPLYKIFTIKFVKWVFNNLTPRGNKKVRSFIHRKNKFLYKTRDILKWTGPIWWTMQAIFLLFKWFFSIILDLLKLDSLFSPEVKSLISRFAVMARYSLNYKSQASIYNFLKKNYPVGTGFVTLSMDMEYIGAGDPHVSYMKQIEELKNIKAKRPEMYPFIFADPRRIAETKNEKGKRNYYTFVTSNLSRKLFSGIKIYPALGYYPFDKDLLPLFEYAQENNIPITTHCDRSTVFYRNKKEKSWNQHPIIKFNKKDGNYVPIPLPQKKNCNFTSNFTHPLNFNCLLDSELLSEYLGEEKNLSKLKICFAHFGGSDEWLKYRNDAWNNYNNNISPVSKDIYDNRKNTLNHESKRTIWWNASWLSVIYDLMVKYENIYADVSFILFNDDLFPLLMYLLQDEKVNHKILLGTDYYMVAQKGVDKELYQNLRSYLGEDLFYLIADINAREFLKTKIPQL